MTELAVGLLGAAATVGVAQLTAGSGFTSRHERSPKSITAGSDTSSSTASSGSPPGSNLAVDDIRNWTYGVHETPEIDDDAEMENRGASDAFSRADSPYPTEHERWHERRSTDAAQHDWKSAEGDADLDPGVLDSDYALPSSATGAVGKTAENGTSSLR
jgi:hypothetical protein